MEAARAATLDDFRHFRAACENHDDGEWTEEFKDAQIRVCSKYAPEGTKGGGLKVLLVVTEYEDLAADGVYSCLMDNDYRTAWDKNQMDGHLVETFDARTCIWYYACRFPVVANRDFVSLSSCMEFSNGDRMTVSRAVVHDSEPPKKGFVRGESVLTVNYVQPNPAGRGCRLTYLSHVDLKGSIPKWLLNAASTKLVPGVMRTLGDTARKYAAFAAHNNPDGRPPAWHTPEVDWDAPTPSAGAADVSPRRSLLAVADFGSAQQREAAAVHGEGVVTLLACGADVDSAAVVQLRACVAEAMQLADHVFMQRHQAPTYPEYAALVLALVRARR